MVLHFALGPACHAFLVVFWLEIFLSIIAKVLAGSCLGCILGKGYIVFLQAMGLPLHLGKHVLRKTYYTKSKLVFASKEVNRCEICCYPELRRS